MEPLAIRNPFPGAGAFHVLETTSTMEEARRLHILGFPAGTVVAADLQSAGRGRLPARHWKSPPAENLLATLILEPEASTLPGLPLRMGLAICRACSILAIRNGLSLGEGLALKWPNDVLASGRKIAGILCEASPGAVFVGFGVNVNQTDFPPELENKATSLAHATGVARLDRFALLELVLEEIKSALVDGNWRADVEELLWRKGERVNFLVGLPDGKEIIEGELLGLAPSSALLISRPGEAIPRQFHAGELLFEDSRVDRSDSHHIR